MAAGAPAAAALSPASLERLLHALTLQCIDDVAASIVSSGLTSEQQAEGLAAEVYGVGIGSHEKAALVAQLLAGLARTDPQRSGRLLQRLIAQRCERALTLTPPPGIANGYQPRMGAMALLAALFNARVVPPAAVHACIGKLLRRGEPSGQHDLDCLHVLLSTAGPRLQTVSPASAASLDGCMADLQRLMDSGLHHPPPPPPLRDSWDYLAPDGVSVFGPFPLYQLLHWVEEGHMGSDVPVRQHNAAARGGAAGWHPLPVAAHAMATGSRLPSGPAPAPPSFWPPPPPASAPCTGAPHPVPEATAQAARPALPAGQATPAPSADPPLGRGSSPPTPTDLECAAKDSPSLRPVPGASAAQRLVQPLRQLVSAIAKGSSPGPSPSRHASSSTSHNGGKYAHDSTSHDDYSSGARGSSHSHGGRHAYSSTTHNGNGGRGGRKYKGVGYADEKEWLVRDGRGNVKGPYAGQDLLQMLCDEKLPEGTWVKKADWKAYKPVEDVEDLILEMFSSKPSGVGAGHGGPAASGMQRGSRSAGHAGNAAKVAARRTLAPLPAVGAAAAAALPDGEVPSTPAQGVPAPQADVRVNEECSESAAALMTTPDPAAASDCPAGVTPPSARFTPGQPAVASGLLAGFTPSPGSSARASLDKPRRPSPGSSAGEEEDEGVPASWLPAASGGPQMAHGPKPAFVAWSSKAG